MMLDRFAPPACCLIFLSCLLPLHTIASTGSDSYSKISINGKHLYFQPPVDMYRAMTESKVDKTTSLNTTETGAPDRVEFSLVKKTPTGGTSSDSGSACFADLQSCAKQDN